MGLHAGDDRLEFIRPDAVTVVFTVFTALQQVVRPLGDGSAVALDPIGLLAQMPADHLIDLAHFFEDTRAFLLQGKRDHGNIVYVIYNNIPRKRRKRQ